MRVAEHVEPSARVVVVNSKPLARERILSLLSAADMEAVGCATAAEALGLLRAAPCKGLVVDYMLDDMSGLELLRVYRCDGPEPVIVMTAGRGEVGAAVRAVRAGVSDFLPDPPDARIVQALRRALARRPDEAG